MTYTSFNSTRDQTSLKPTIFLAGSIGLTPDNQWRTNIISSLGEQYDFFDPRHPDHDALSNEDMRDHIQWELNSMEQADSILLHFLPDAKSPISLVELGMYVRSRKLIVICSKEFYKWRYVDVLCKHYDVPIYQTIHEVLGGKEPLITSLH